MQIIETPPTAQIEPLDTAGLARVGRAMPNADLSPVTRTTQLFGALDNFARVFDIRADDRALILADQSLDPHVIAALDGFARSRGVAPITVTYPNAQEPSIPDAVRPILANATFVMSTWFCSIVDPFCVGLRRQNGQRWVKLTHFRSVDLMYTPQARFPLDLLSEIIRATANRYRAGRGDLVVTDRRGSELVIGLTPDTTAAMLSANRWKGDLTASTPGAYVHFLPTHGPNLYERVALTTDDDEIMPIDGIVYPQWAVGFPEPFVERIGVRFARDRVVEVTGESVQAQVLREMLLGGKLIELGCGFNPKAPRHRIYPAGSNSPGALHFGIDLAQPSRYIARTMPNWEEPPVHMDLVTFDSTARVGSTDLVVDGFLPALRDANVIALATRFGKPEDLLEAWPEEESAIGM